MRKWANIPIDAPIQIPTANISAGCARQFYHPKPYTTWSCQLSWSPHHCRLEPTSRYWTIAETWINASRSEPSRCCRKDHSPPLQSPFLVSIHLDHLVPSPAFQQCTTHSKSSSGTRGPPCPWETFNQPIQVYAETNTVSMAASNSQLGN